MPQYLSPGVYVEEVPSAVKAIAGVGTSTAGFIGVFPDRLTSPLYKVTNETIIETKVTNETIETEGKAQAGAAGPPATITLAASASTADDFYNHMRIAITGGAGSGQVLTITDYVGETRVVTVNSNWTTVPNNTSTYAVKKSSQ